MSRWLIEELDPRPLAVARIGVGVAALIRVVPAWWVLSDLTDPGTLRAPYADWIPQPTTWLAVAIVTIWVLAAVGFILGWRLPLSGSALLAAIVASLAMDQQSYSNHLYLMAWLVFLMIVADAGAGLSVGGGWRTVVRWPVVLIMAQASIVYGFSGLTKLNPDFLSGTVLASVLHGGLVPFPDQLRTPGVLSLLAALVVTTELFLAIFLWRPRFQWIAVIAGVALHGGITLLMSATLELLVFSIEMLALYPLFLSRPHISNVQPLVSSRGLP